MDLTRQYWNVRRETTALLVTFPGHHLVPLAWLLTRLPRKRLLFDAFISLTDTLVSDRKRLSWYNPIAWMLFFAEYMSYHLADEILIDTEAHKHFFAKRFFLNPNRIRVIYLGTREDLFAPRGTSCSRTDASIEILFYGTFIPLQGIEHIIDAAAILQNNHPEIHFTLIGSGQTRKEMEARAQEKKLRNLRFEECIAYEALPQRIRNADICLGIFGTSGKAQRVIPHKVYDAVACGVPVITARSPAILERFVDGREVILCNPGDPQDLSRTILRMAGTLRSRNTC